MTQCKECGVEKEVGEKTGYCLECLDWILSELRK